MDTFLYEVSYKDSLFNVIKFTVWDFNQRSNFNSIPIGSYAFLVGMCTTVGSNRVQLGANLTLDACSHVWVCCNCVHTCQALIK